MRNTLRQTSVLENYAGGKYGATITENKISHLATDNMTIDDKREITANFSRPANGKGDCFGPWIDRDNVNLVEPILYSHIPNPSMSFNYTARPILDKDEIIDNANIHLQSKPSIKRSGYYINNNFINTLNDNPLVNDIYHQKNYNL